MKAFEIQRVAIREEETVYEPIKDDLFDKCRERLGYDANDSRASQANSAGLMFILKKAGIEPLSLRDVHKYQAFMLRKVTRFYLRLALHISAVLVLNGIAGYYSGWSFNLLHGGDNVEIALGYFLTLLIEGGVFGLLASLVIWGPGKTWEWRSSDLKGYNKPIPEFALSQALAIQEVNPHVHFYIEELREQEKIADPFLRVSFGDRTSYIAVWDEPRFEGRKAK